MAALRWLPLRATGAVLAAAAILKAFGGPDPTSGEWYRGVQPVAIALEWVIGVWLLSGFRPVAARWAGLSLVTCLLAAATYLWVSGEENCGCLGGVTIPPVAMVVIDALMWTSLLAGRPKQHGGVRMGMKHQIAASLVVVATGMWLGLASPVSVLGEANAERPTAEQSGDEAPTHAGDKHRVELAAKRQAQSTNIGYVEPASTREYALTLVNPAEEPRTVADYKVECVCTEIDGLPVTVPPGGEVTVTLRFIALKKRTTYTKAVVLKSESPDVAGIKLEVTARIGIPMEVRPAKVHITPKTTDSTTVTVVNDGDAVRLLYATSTVPGLTVVVPAEPIERGTEAELRVSLTNGVQDDPIDGTVTIHTSSPDQPAIHFAVTVAR